MSQCKRSIIIVACLLIAGLVLSSPILFAQADSVRQINFPDSINHHKVVLDKESRIISWIRPQSNAYGEFLRQRWNYIKTKTVNRPPSPTGPSYPQYYFYCAYRYKEGQLQPDTWMNDVGERIPNWFESARLYYGFTGDSVVMSIVENLANYAIDHGTSPASFDWPNFPYTTANAGDTLFTGFTSAGRFVMHEIQVDHAGEMGLTYFRLYLYTGKEKYKTAAIQVANTLARKVRTNQSPWPYRVVMSTGEIKAEYGANWFGCYDLLDNLVKAKLGNVDSYRLAMKKVQNFILQFPMQTGYWTDGHTDTNVNSSTYKSNMSASNATLYLLDHPEFDPNWKSDVPKLIQWTEDNFVTRCAPGEPSNQWGANLVGEQDEFLFKMDYQTARYGAECARWYAVSGNPSYKEKAYRSLNWVTYCSDSIGLASESPVSKGISSWWSDCYGEGPRMFYPAMAFVPEWAPAHENHILYSTGILKNVTYLQKKVLYKAVEKTGIEYLKLAFKPTKITLNGKNLAAVDPTQKSGYLLKALEGGDHSLTIKRTISGTIEIDQ